MQWVLLAPGPSMSESLASRVRGQNVGAVGNAYQLAPWADFLAATDRAWWEKHPDAKRFAGRRYSPNCLPWAEQVKCATVFSGTNSGVLALECAKRNGATRILMLGFDMHGSHFFGPYNNGLRNTTDSRRKHHLVQYAQWRRVNKDIEVLNCTDGSALKCFPEARLDDFCSDVQVAHSGVSGEVHGDACEHAASHGAEALQVAAPLHLHHG